MRLIFNIVLLFHYGLFFLFVLVWFLLCSVKVPLLGLELKFFAVIGILCGTALSFFNYFRVIFGGGVGKNGSTIAVSCSRNQNEV